MTGITNISSSSVGFGNNNNNNNNVLPTYNKTHAGLCTGAGSSTLGLLGAAIMYSNKGAKEYLRTPYIVIPAMIATNLGCGAIIDKLINDKRKKFAEETQGLNAQEAIAMNEKAELNRAGQPYLKQGTGKLYGTLLGVVANPLYHLVQVKKVSAIGCAFTAILGAIGGFILGAITDYFANKGAAKIKQS